MSDLVAISCYHKDFELSHLALLTSKNNVRVTAHFVRLNTFMGEEGREENKLAYNMYLRGFEDILFDVSR